MKLYKITFILTLAVLLNACSLEENPPYLSNGNVYSTVEDARRAVDGMYAGMVEYGYMGNQYFFALNLNSGFGVTRKGGNKNTNIDNSTLASLKPSAATPSTENVWVSAYRVIARANDALAAIQEIEDPQTEEEIALNDIVGQSYFMRAFNYFNLVRLWGEIPLRTQPASKETIHLGKSSVKEVYAQIINDAEAATRLMSGLEVKGYAQKYAAHMLLAKVYMTLATAPADVQEAGVNYWQKAYDHAIEVYGKYELVDDYASLFNEETSDNTSESIFELQSAVGASLDFVRAFTPNFYTQAKTFGLLKVNVDVYDRHAATYPDDPRLAPTYLGTYTNQAKGTELKGYPDLTTRTSFLNGFPYFFKFAAKNPANDIREGNQNHIIYRYADLLLMLAEISNELQNGEQLSYVTEVLDRVGLTPHAGYLGTQDEFRTAIMNEYTYELLGEGHDWYNNRRRGYDFFLNNVIIPHNTAPNFDGSIDVTLAEDESVMLLPIPSAEINNNEAIFE